MKGELTRGRGQEEGNDDEEVWPSFVHSGGIN